MNEKPIPKNLPQDFTNKFSGYTDQEIIAILKKRDHYQEKAVVAAVREALKRGIIQSENDLLGTEYRVEPMPFQLFPTMENERLRARIKKSMGRALLFVGVLPTLWGGLKIYRGDSFHGLVITLTGLLWLAVTYRMIRTRSTGGTGVLLIIFAAGVVYLSQLLWNNSFTTATDVFIAIVCSLLLLYGLLFFRTLDQN